MTLALELKEGATGAWLDFRMTSEHDCHILSILPFFGQKRPLLLSEAQNGPSPSHHCMLDEWGAVTSLFSFQV